MVRNDGAPCRRRAGVRLVPALAIVLALGAIRAEGTLGAEDTREVFDILDDSHDGLITRQEFLRTKIRVFYGFLKIVDVDQHLDPEHIKITPEAFAEADLNDDGKMTGAEFVQAPFSQFDAIDANGDQGITFDEFRDFMRRYQP
jgi:Ca2+-binding EF-hand superfamily protein